MGFDIEFRNVSKLYNDNTLALENASFKIKKGEFVFVIGRNGAGKSTLLNLITANLIPTEGTVMVDGLDTKNISEKEMPYFRRQFGIVSRKIDLLSDMNVYENIVLAMRAAGQPSKIIKTRIESTLSTMGVLNKKDSYPEELSGGEYAKVMIVRAIVTDPKVMVFDEPTANLSPSHAWDIMCMIEDLSRLGITVVVISHNRELVTVLKKRVMTLVSGVIVSDTRYGIYDDKKMDIFEEKRVADERKFNKK